jgi:hypothetical protein
MLSGISRRRPRARQVFVLGSHLVDLEQIPSQFPGQPPGFAQEVGKAKRATQKLNRKAHIQRPLDPTAKARLKRWLSRGLFL